MTTPHTQTSRVSSDLKASSRKAREAEAKVKAKEAARAEAVARKMADEGKALAEEVHAARVKAVSLQMREGRGRLGRYQQYLPQ